MANTATKRPAGIPELFRGPFGGIAAKILLLSIVPVLAIAGMVFYANRGNSRLTRDTIEEQTRATAAAAEVSRQVFGVQERMLELTQALNSVVRTHQQNLLQPIEAPANGIQQTQLIARNCIINFESQINALSSAMAGSHLTEGASNNSGMRLERQVAYLRRWSANLPRLFELFQNANARTNTALTEGRPGIAMSNYIYEEGSRLESLDSRINQMAAVLNSLVDGLTVRQRDRRDSQTARIIGNIEMSNLWLLSLIGSATLILLGMAMLYSHYGLSRPLMRLAAAMRSLSSGDTNVKIPEGHGEIGEMSRTVAVFRDNAIQKDITEAQLRQAQKMESVGQLTGGIAHDFNNLLTVVLGNLELVEERLETDSGLRELIGRVMGAADRGANLTQRLLAFSRKQTLQPTLIDIGDLIPGMLDLVRRTLGAAIEIEWRIEDTDCRSRIDPIQLESALLNLAINAKAAMPQGGALTIVAANVFLDEEYVRPLPDVSVGPYVRVSVTDTGTGIPPELIDKVFDPFFTTKKVGEGSGLGLSMIFGFVKQSGGHVEIDSTLGEGTTISLYLPRFLEA